MKSALDVSISDLVRNHVIERYLRPALQKGDAVISINVGAVHRELGFNNRVPLVCAALKSKKFLGENGLRIVSQTGPPSGQSTTVTFTYELRASSTQGTASANPLIGLRGIAKDIFKKLGGGEAFIRSERNSFSSERDKA
ncbi:MAG TPA: hypothetical protein VI488_03955 [Candidatus Angelobacter sp.]